MNDETLFSISDALLETRRIHIGIAHYPGNPETCNCGEMAGVFKALKIINDYVDRIVELKRGHRECVDLMRGNTETKD